MDLSMVPPLGVLMDYCVPCDPVSINSDPGDNCRRDLLACTTWFHQSQVYQPICTNLTCTKLICTKPHFYHPPKNGRTHSGKLALTGDPLAGAITHDFCRGKYHERSPFGGWYT